jgi:hypothetical protein
MLQDIIDCDAEPFIPVNWSVEEHQRGGKFPWNTDVQKKALYFSRRQLNGRHIEGFLLRDELRGKPVMNACGLEYLLANRHQIPEGWEDKCIPFWATIYRSSTGLLCVRCLRLVGGRPEGWDANYLGYDFNGACPAALYAR